MDLFRGILALAGELRLKKPDGGPRPVAPALRQISFRKINMEPTQVKPGARTQDLPVPVGPAQPEAYQRAPTLMAGEEAGRQGQVHVWSPDIRAIRRQAWAMGTLLGGTFLIYMALAMTTHGNPAGMFCQMTVPIIFLCAAVSALRRPCYLTTDEEGIGVTTTRSSRALRWEEILSLEQQKGAVTCWKLTLTSSETLNLNLTGYTPASLETLQSLVTGKAALKPDPKKKNLYLRVPASLQAGSPRDSLPPSLPSQSRL